MSDQSKPKVGLPSKRKMRHDSHFVDELARRMGEGIGRMVQVTTITSNHDLPLAPPRASALRRAPAADQAGVNRIGSSIIGWSMKLGS